MQMASDEGETSYSFLYNDEGTLLTYSQYDYVGDCTGAPDETELFAHDKGDFDGCAPFGGDGLFFKILEIDELPEGVIEVESESDSEESEA